MAGLHDGDTFVISTGDNPIYAEFLDTNGRLGWRLVDRHGKGILLDRSAMERLSLLTQIALGFDERNLQDFMRTYGGK